MTAVSQTAPRRWLSRRLFVMLGAFILGSVAAHLKLAGGDADETEGDGTSNGEELWGG